MGKTGRKIVEVDVKGLIDDLNQALAAEWLAAYQYWAAAQVIEGLQAPIVTEFLEEQVKDEMGHASKLAKRIVELGGSPVANPSQLAKVAGSTYYEPPKDRSDLAQVLRNARKTEAAVIQGYNQLAKKLFGKDPVTYQMVTDILAAEVHEEEETENRLAKL